MGPSADSRRKPALRGRVTSGPHYTPRVSSAAGLFDAVISSGRLIVTRDAAQLTAFLAIALLSGRGVQAQEQAGAPYVLAGLAFPHQQGPSGATTGQTYVSAPAGT